MGFVKVLIVIALYVAIIILFNDTNHMNKCQNDIVQKVRHEKPWHFKPLPRVKDIEREFNNYKSKASDRRYFKEVWYDGLQAHWYADGS